jgi:hypothetical protein
MLAYGSIVDALDDGQRMANQQFLSP